MSKILKSNVKVVKKNPSEAKTRAQTHCICSKRNCALIFKISLPQENFVSGGLKNLTLMKQICHNCSKCLESH